eukprot:UN03951
MCTKNNANGRLKPPKSYGTGAGSFSSIIKRLEYVFLDPLFIMHQILCGCTCRKVSSHVCQCGVIIIFRTTTYSICS